MERLVIGFWQEPNKLVAFFAQDSYNLGLGVGVPYRYYLEATFLQLWSYDTLQISQIL